MRPRWYGSRDCGPSWPAHRASSRRALRDGEVAGDDIRVPYDKTTVKDAPRISDSDGHLSEDEEATLYRYYGTEGAEHDTSYAGSNDTHGTVGHDTSGPETDSSMTRSEEQVRVGTETREAGRVRLRKYVVTENVTQTVPVERVRVGKDTVTEQHEVDETVRKEEIELDESDASSRTASDRTRH